MLSVKPGGIKFHFLKSLWYDSTLDWTQVSRAIGEHSNRWANVPVQMSNSSIWHIDRTLSGATTPSQIGPGSYDNETVL